MTHSCLFCCKPIFITVINAEHKQICKLKISFLKETIFLLLVFFFSYYFAILVKRFCVMMKRKTKTTKFSFLYKYSAKILSFFCFFIIKLELIILSRSKQPFCMSFSFLCFLCFDFSFIGLKTTNANHFQDSVWLSLTLFWNRYKLFDILIINSLSINDHA